jgi:preprotein translocase subunit SecA
MAHSQLAHKIVQSLKAHHLFQRDVHYVIKDGEVVIVDEFTGRLMFGRRFSDGLHQAIEAKERVQVGKENQTLATITLQNYFRMYRKLAGMTGTAATEAEEFKEIYGLEVIVVPTNRPCVRVDHPDVIYRTQTEKFAAAADEVAELHERGCPVLVGTTSIESSERMSRLLKARKVPHEVLNAKQHEREAAIVAQAGALGAVTVATNMAGRGTDIVLGGNAEFRALEEAQRRGIDVDGDGEALASLKEEIRRACEEEKQKVLDLGGLHIVGTERHEARRIDNQLRGRSGRQGDPGSSRFYLSLEDDLLRLFGSDRIQGLMGKLGMEEGEAIEHPILSRSIESAQKKVEEMHFDIRRQLLMYDNVMNQQREAVYGERHNILFDEAIVDHTWDIVAGALQSILDKAFPDEGEADPESARLRIKGLFGPGLDGRLEGVTSADLLPPAREALRADLKGRFDAKVAELGEETATQLFRFITLNVLDSHWKEHLLAMDELRRGIGLRAIGQKDPLVEYQFESYNLFQEMLDRVRQSVAELVLRVSVVPDETRRRTPEGIQEGRALSIPLRTADQEAAAMAGHGGRTKEPVRKGPKVGRNDPCPCGSGRKYKHCCGKHE